MSEHARPTNEPCPYCGQLRVNQIITSVVPVVDPYVTGSYKVPGEFNSFLKRLKEKNPGSNINTV